MNRIKYKLHPTGLGTNIGLLSMLTSGHDSYHIETYESYTLGLLKTVFNIPDEKILITHYFQKNGPSPFDDDHFLHAMRDTLDLHHYDGVVDKIFSNFDRVSDTVKFLYPYFDVNILNLHGDHVHLKPMHKKKFILLTMYRDHNDLINHHVTDKEWPYVRYATLNEYAFLFKLIKLAGYEIITVDNLNISLQEKIRFMNDNVACVIGYEGGLCHLAHVLKIPCIILPWFNKDDPDPGPGVLKNVQKLLVHMYHMDKKTYIPENFDEMASWDADKLKKIIESLRYDHGNNWFINNPVKFLQDLKEFYFYMENQSYLCATKLSQFEIDFYQRNLTKASIFNKPLDFIK